MDTTTALAILVNAGLITGLVEAIKRALGDHFNSDRWGPLLSLAVGEATAIGGVYAGWYSDVQQLGPAILVGLVAGLTSSGLYRAQQQVRTATPPPDEPSPVPSGAFPRRGGA